jgi:G3E family GTPase
MNQSQGRDHEPTKTDLQRRTPVTVFCGFLGAGKTTLLRHLLGQAATAEAAGGGGVARWAAVVNDVAAVNIDGAVVGADNAARAALGAEGAAEVVELGNGCVCCSGADDLGEAIARLAASGLYGHIWVETSGVAEPRGIATLFTRKNPFGKTLGDFARLAALVTVVDVVAFAREAEKAGAGGVAGTAPGRAPTGGGERPVFELMVEQAECADVVVLNQCDRATEAGGELARAEALVAGLNARAELVRTERGQVTAEFFTGRQRFDPAATVGAARWINELNRAAAAPAPGDGFAARPRVTRQAYHELRYGITSLVYRARAPFDAGRLNALFAAGLPGVLRAKGFFWTTRSPDEMGFVSVAGGVVRWETLSVWWSARIASGRARMEDRPPAVAAHWAEPHGDRRQEIVLIGVGVEAREAELRAALDGCLAVA